MTPREDPLAPARGLLVGLLLSIPIWAGILMLAFNLARAWAHYPQWSWIVK